MKLFNLFVWDGLFYVLSTLQQVSLHRMQGLLVLVLCFLCVFQSGSRPVPETMSPRKKSH